MEEKAKTPFLKPALIYGAILGFAAILLSVIFYVLNLQFKTWTQLVSLVVIIAVLAYTLKAYRDEYLGGFASYGQILLMLLGIAVVSTILSTLYQYILISYIDVDYLEKSQQAVIERWANNPRITESQLDALIERTEGSIGKGRIIRNSLIWGTVVTFIIGMIVAAFIKKDENPVDQQV